MGRLPKFQLWSFDQAKAPRETCQIDIYALMMTILHRHAQGLDT